jgi:phosphatidylglycerophosphate synthase
MVRRVHRSLLTPAEKRLLVRLAGAVPRWVTPDMLTALGVAGAAVAFAGYLLSARDPAYLWLASLGLLIHWFGDSLDGTLARVRNAERPRYGFVLDQTVDVVSDLFILGGLGLSPYARLDTALLALIGYHALAIQSLAWCAVKGEHRISGAIFGPTELRIVLIAVNTALWAGGAPKGFLGFADLTWCDGLMLAAFAMMALVFFAGLVADARALRGERED